ncbi:MAG: rRNA maturation RNase YbeY [Flavobacteriaceae bacterium]
MFAKKKIIVFHHIPEFLNGKLVQDTLKAFIETEGFGIDQLVYNFVSKSQLLELNQTYLNHDTHTDVITFDYTEDKKIKAEVFISLWAVAISAEEEGQSIENETLRVLSHAALHCMGLKDKTADEKSRMRAKENEFIDLFHVKHNKYV